MTRLLGLAAFLGIHTEYNLLKALLVRQAVGAVFDSCRSQKNEPLLLKLRRRPHIMYQKILNSPIYWFQWKITIFFSRFIIFQVSPVSSILLFVNIGTWSTPKKINTYFRRLTHIFYRIVCWQWIITKALFFKMMMLLSTGTFVFFTVFFVCVRDLCVKTIKFYI